MARYEERKKGVWDKDAEKIITPVNTFKWRQYEKWLIKQTKNQAHYPPTIFNS